MRAKALLVVFALLALAGCGSAKIVSPKPQTVIGSVPTQTAPATTSTTAATTTTATTGGGGGGGGGGGKAVFASNGCGSCHTFKAAGSNGKIGPDLDKLAQYAKQAKQPLDKFVRESITDPKAYVQPGFQPVMPSFASISKPQLDSLVQFLTKGS
ncbi:MAG TPA: c-type cytochrome [Gaiellaceae bacterium]